MTAQVREVRVIFTAREPPLFRDRMGDGSTYGTERSYVDQKEPHGLADPFFAGGRFVDRGRACLGLGELHVQRKSRVHASLDTGIHGSHPRCQSPSRR